MKSSHRVWFGGICFALCSLAFSRAPLDVHSLESLTGMRFQTGQSIEQQNTGLDERCLYQQSPSFKKEFAFLNAISNGLMIGSFDQVDLNCWSEFVGGLWYEKQQVSRTKNFSSGRENLFPVPKLNAGIWKQTDILFCLSSIEACLRYSGFIEPNRYILIVSKDRLSSKNLIPIVKNHTVLLYHSLRSHSMAPTLIFLQKVTAN